MTLEELITDLKASGANENTIRLAMNCYELWRVNEREICAKLCETHGVHPYLSIWNGGPDWYKHGKELAAAIRSRGNA